MKEKKIAAPLLGLAMTGYITVVGGCARRLSMPEALARYRTASTRKPTSELLPSGLMPTRIADRKYPGPL